MRSSQSNFSIELPEKIKLFENGLLSVSDILTADLNLIFNLQDSDMVISLMLLVVRPDMNNISI